MDNQSPSANASAWLTRRPLDPEPADERDQEIAKLKERLNFYESFDTLIQENVTRAGELLRHAATVHENADKAIAEVRQEVEDTRLTERLEMRSLLSGLLDEVTTTQVQVERLARKVADALDDLEATLPTSVDLDNLPAVSMPVALGALVIAEPLDPTPEEIGPSDPLMLAQEQAASTSPEVIEAEVAAAQAAEIVSEDVAVESVETEVPEGTDISSDVDDLIAEAMLSADGAEDVESAEESEPDEPAGTIELESSNLSGLAVNFDDSAPDIATADDGRNGIDTPGDDLVVAEVGGAGADVVNSIEEAGEPAIEQNTDVAEAIASEDVSEPVDVAAMEEAAEAGEAVDSIESAAPGETAGDTDVTNEEIAAWEASEAQFQEVQPAQTGAELLNPAALSDFEAAADEAMPDAPQDMAAEGESSPQSDDEAITADVAETAVDAEAAVTPPTAAEDVLDGIEPIVAPESPVVVSQAGPVEPAAEAERTAPPARLPWLNNDPRPASSEGGRTRVRPQTGDFSSVGAPRPTGTQTGALIARGLSTVVLVHGVPRATTALSLKRYLESLPHVLAVEPREYAEGILRLHVVGQQHVKIEDLRGWTDGADLQPVHIREDLIEVRLPH
jgi:hypothetical protein